ncbi:MAG: hypothetical protein ACOCSK_03225, partial [Rhodothermales bacterium]
MEVMPRRIPIVVRRTAAEVARVGAVRVMNGLRHACRPVLCAASGSSPIPLYTELARLMHRELTVAHKTSVVKLDEWIGSELHEPGSCHHAIRTQLVEPAGVPPENYIGFDSAPECVQGEPERIDRFLEKWGP